MRADPSTSADFDDRRVTKRRWTDAETSTFKKAFQANIDKKEMACGANIAAVQKVMGTCTIAQIRTRLNNIILGKQKLSD